jgi:MoaA/NifB/PqqE/SkfB family radical SAM enzyme
LEASENKRTRNPNAYVVTVIAEKAAASLRVPLQRQPKAKLSRVHASETLKELWVFPVAPETCNLACTHCLYAASPKTRNPYRLSASEFFEILAQVEAAGARPRLMFTGGEPTLHPELCDFLDAADRRGYSFQLMTNGTRIQQPLVERLSRMSHLTKVQMSLESVDAEIHDSIYGRGIQNRVLKAADLLKDNRVPVTLAVTPMAVNEQGISAIEALADAQDVEVKYISLYDLGAARENHVEPARENPMANDQSETELMCDKGVAYSEGAFYPCPVLVKEPQAKLGNRLEEALSPQARRKVAELQVSNAACQVCLKGST